MSSKERTRYVFNGSGMAMRPLTRKTLGTPIPGSRQCSRSDCPPGNGPLAVAALKQPIKGESVKIDPEKEARERKAKQQAIWADVSRFL